MPEIYGRNSILNDLSGRASACMYFPIDLAMEGDTIAVSGSRTSEAVLVEGFRHFQVYVERSNAAVPLVIDVVPSPSEYLDSTPVFWPWQTIGQWPAGRTRELFYFGVGNYKESTIEDVHIANPGAGNNWSHAVPLGQSYIVHQCRLNFTASPVAANRLVYLSFLNEAGVAVGYWGFPDYQQVANTSHTYSYGPYGWAFQAPRVGVVVVPTPGRLDLLGGWRLNSFVSNMQAADNFANIRLVVERIDADDRTTRQTPRLRFCNLLKVVVRNLSDTTPVDVSVWLDCRD